MTPRAVPPTVPLVVPPAVPHGEADAPLLRVRDLRVAFRLERGGRLEALRGLDFALARGETLGLVGESGSGKSQAALALVGLLAPNGRASGSARFDGEELIGAPPALLRRVRGRRIGMVFQEPTSALDPLFTIGHQVALPLRAHRGLGRGAAAREALDWLDRVGLPRARSGAYPHELSGGQRQRAMIAMALAGGPDLLVADEPTTALDVTVQAEILDLLADLKARLSMAMLFITHDLGVVRGIADRTLVLRDGRGVEEGATAALFAAPREAYTRALVAAEPPALAPRPTDGAPVVAEARGLQVTYPGGPWPRRAPARPAVADVDLTLRAGRTLGVVGESGSGKSSLGRAVLRLEPAASGLVRFEDRDLGPLDRARLRPLRRRMQPVFQDPLGSLSPRSTVGEIVAEGLRVHEPGLARGERDRRAAAALAEVRLDPNLRHRYPHALSGGQRQRVAIARAMILRPRLVVLDEPTSALDRTVQREVIALLRALQEAHGLAYLFISHDLAAVRALADEILVMRDGRVVERGPAGEVLGAPREAYTRALVAAAGLGATPRAAVSTPGR